MFNSAKKRAILYNMEFNISKSNIAIPNTCPFLEIEFSENNPPTLDRIDCTRGYTSDNIHVICMNANRSKNDCTLSEYGIFVNNLSNNKICTEKNKFFDTLKIPKNKISISKKKGNKKRNHFQYICR